MRLIKISIIISFINKIEERDSTSSFPCEMIGAILSIIKSHDIDDNIFLTLIWWLNSVKFVAWELRLGGAGAALVHTPCNENSLMYMYTP